MIPLNEFGYRSRAAFLRDENPSQGTFEAMANHEYWVVQKSVLYHPKCPLEIRKKFANDAKWYKRLVAYFTNAAPKDFWRIAKDDPSIHVRNVYFRWIKFYGEVFKQIKDNS